MTLHLSKRDIPTLVAALHAWQNELSYHTVEELAEWHPELTGHEPLSIAEVDGLLRRLAAAPPIEGSESSVSTVSTVSKGGPLMAPAIRRVRELVASYKPLRARLPVNGTASCPREAARLAAAILADTTVEQVLALHFDTKRKLIGVHVVSLGTLDASLVHPRDVFKAACLSNASALIVAHNHPSGDPTPNGEDRALSKRLRLAGELLGVELLDFLIVTDPAEGLRYLSFTESGLL